MDTSIQIVLCQLRMHQSYAQFALQGLQGMLTNRCLLNSKKLVNKIKKFQIRLELLHLPLVRGAAVLEDTSAEDTKKSSLVSITYEWLLCWDLTFQFPCYYFNFYITTVTILFLPVSFTLFLLRKLIYPVYLLFAEWNRDI